MNMVVPETRRTRPGRTKRLTAAKMAPPSWFGWLGVAAMFLLVAVRIRSGDGEWFFPLLSLGEWLLLPLGACSLTMGLLALWKVRERTWLPLWLSAIAPGALWLAAVGVSILRNDATAASGDIMLAWAVHLLFPTMAFLPLLAQPLWRDRLLWALAAGLVVNAALIFLQGRASGLAASDTGLLFLGGLLANQYDYGLMLAVALPLLAAWRGGETREKRALATLMCTFLIPALTLSACFSWAGMAAAAAGLAVSLIAWRWPAWIMGVFLCLLLFGQGSEARRERDADARRLLAASAALGGEQYRMAFDTFQLSPYFGAGPEMFISGDGRTPAGKEVPTPWYATLLGGGGLLGLGMWLVLLAEVAARALGKYGRHCLLRGGVLGGVAGLAVASLWTDAMPEGAGAMVGLLLAISILEEEIPLPTRRGSTILRRKKKAPLEGAREIGFYVMRNPANDDGGKADGAADR